MKRILLLMVALLMFAGPCPDEALADGVTGGVDPSEAVITGTDSEGHVWDCVAYDPEKGCNTGTTWIDGNGARHVLWIDPEGRHVWRRSSAYPDPGPVTSETVVPETGPAYWCPDGSGPFPAR